MISKFFKKLSESQFVLMMKEFKKITKNIKEDLKELGMEEVESKSEAEQIPIENLEHLRLIKISRNGITK